MHKVLVVDDEPFIRVSLASLRTWKNDGFDFCYEAGNGQQALDLMAEHKDIDLILLDLAMPVMDGLSFLEKLNSRRPDEAGGEDYRKTPSILVLSAHDEFHMVRKAFKLGIHDYIIKTDIDESSLLEHAEKAVAIKFTGTQDSPEKTESGLSETDRLFLKNRLLTDMLDRGLSVDGASLFPKLKLELSFPIVLLSLWIADFEKVRSQYAENEQVRFHELFFRTTRMCFDTRWKGEIVSPEFGHIVVFANFDRKNSADQGTASMTAQAIEFASELADSLREAFLRYINVKVDIAASVVCGSPGDIKPAYETVRRAKQPLSKAIVQARKYMLEHFAEPEISLSDIAAACDCSKNYLSWEFKKETGETVVEYITKLRIEKACTLITDTAMKVYEVSETVGFSNVEHFCRVFKRSTGVSPNHYVRKFDT